MPLHMTMTMVRQCQDERGRDKNGTRKARRLTGREASDLLPYTGRKGDIREERITRREIKRTKKMESVGNAWKYQSLSNMPLERKNFHSDLNDFWYGGRIGRYSVAHFQEDNILHIFKMNILELILGSILSVRFFFLLFFSNSSCSYCPSASDAQVDTIWLYASYFGENKSERAKFFKA